MQPHNMARLQETLHAILNDEEQHRLRRQFDSRNPYIQALHFYQLYYATEDVRLAVKVISQNWEKVRKQEIVENPIAVLDIVK